MAALKNVHLLTEGEDDIYEGFSDFQANDLEDDPEFQRAIATQQGRNKRPPLSTAATGGVYRNLRTGVRMGTQMGGARLGTQMGGARLGTGYAADTGLARPITSTGAAGFSNRDQIFDPLGQMVGGAGGASTSKIPVPPLNPKPSNSPEVIIKQLEAKVNSILEESAEAATRGDDQMALDKAKEASRSERILCKEREKASMTDQINLDITYSVLFNLASQYHANRLYQEAQNTYMLIVRNKMFGSGGRLRVNLGNTYYEQKKYPLAIKNYRMALDQIPETHRRMRFKILQNICTVFVKTGQYNDAINTYEHIHSELKDKVDFRTSMNLLLCYYALGDKEKLKRHFQRMTLITTGAVSDEDQYYITDDTDTQQRLLVEAIKDDPLRKQEKEDQHRARHTILTAAKLIAPVIESSFATGFDWCIEVIKSSQHSELASELEITKALTFLRENDTTKAIETLKECGRKDSKMATTAATNLSFVFYLQGDYTQAEKYADAAIQHDHYNPHALVNKGNCLFSMQKYNEAKGYYKEALSVEATCSEALFNLGLTFKRLGDLPSALERFNKLQAIFKNLPQVLFNIADIYDKLDDYDQATEWFLHLVTLVPTDPAVLQRLGEIYDNHDEKSLAFQYYYESFRYCPSNIEVISWLGAYYMESHFIDKAIGFFEKAALIQPAQVNWPMMVASCHRKTGNYKIAYKCYVNIHKLFPENVDCLKFLYRLASNLGLKEAQDYSMKLRKAEKSKEDKKQRDVSGGRGSKKGGVNSLTTNGNIHSMGSDESMSGQRHVDESYADPLGNLPERPRTSARGQPPSNENEFIDDDELGDLLPE